MAILKLLLILVLIGIGIRRRIFVGYLLGVAGVLTPLLFGLEPLDCALGLWGTVRSLDFWKLLGAIVIVTILGHLLKEIGSLDRLTAAAQELVGGKRTAVALLPAAVGLMPMPGGAVLSAPLVEEVLKEENHSPAFLTAANYWFRHVMEFFWPLYPGIILGSGIVGISVQKFALLGMVMSASMLTLGYLFFLRRIGNRHQPGRTIISISRIAASLWPLFLAVFLALSLGIEIVLALIIALAAVVVIHRDSLAHLWPVIKEVVTIRLFFMVFGILLFKDMLELSGAVGAIPAEVMRLGIPSAAVIFTVAFLSGLLSGMVAAFVGLSFPILAGYLYQPEIHLGNIFLTYLSGYLGMILSPTHFCLLLSAEHFKTDLGPVYKTFGPPLLILALIGFGLYFTGYPWQIIRP